MFETKALHDHPGFIKEMGCKGWMKLNNLIKERNIHVALEIYVNTHNRGTSQFVSFIRGKPIDYNSDIVNVLLGLRAQDECGI